MKSCFPIVLILSALGCSSSTDPQLTSNNPLIGTWVSNCHEFLGTGDDVSSNLYNISEITFSESGYVDRYVSYTDMGCTAGPVEESSAFDYTVGDTVITTDGVAATRFTATAILPNRPDLEFTVEAIYRITGVDLNFGPYTDGETPSLDLTVTYTRQ